MESFKREHIKSNMGEMMEQAINIILQRTKKIDEVRAKYDKDYKKFESHINLVYPFEGINQKELYKHIEKSIEEIKSFKLVLKGLKKSAKDYYLYLLVDKGKRELMKLYKNLNKGLLKNFKNKAMPQYIPHLSLGVFRNKKEIDIAINKLKKEKLKAEYIIDEINLLTLNKSLTIKSRKKFELK